MLIDVAMPDIKVSRAAAAILNKRPGLPYLYVTPVESFLHTVLSGWLLLLFNVAYWPIASVFMVCADFRSLRGLQSGYPQMAG